MAVAASFNLEPSLLFDKRFRGKFGDDLVAGFRFRLRACRLVRSRRASGERL
jgi:hypothetical protein